MNAQQSVLLITPPLTQLNSPYPATMVLKGYLKTKGYAVKQLDLSIELINKIFTSSVLAQIFDELESKNLSKRFSKMLRRRYEYEHWIEEVIAFLQNPKVSNDLQLQSFRALPRGQRFDQFQNLEFVNAKLSTEEEMITIGTYFLQDLSDLIRENINHHFELIRYGEKICASIADFTDFEKNLPTELTLIDTLMLERLEEEIRSTQPQIIGFSIPFPGNFYATLIGAQWIRAHFPHIKIVMGGGFVSTELRQMTQNQLFNYTHYLVFDDGELPLERILQLEAGQISSGQLVRTFTFDGKQIQRHQVDSDENIPFSQRGFADYSGIKAGQYISLMETPNPMLNLWSKGFWNKITLAHGCYWAQCAFCDTSLDYIKRYQPAKASYLVDQMELMMEQTGSSGFHFTDEAAPPALLRKVSEEIIKRKLKIEWWGNLRFERSFDESLCQLMADAGCIAVSGGLETVSPRLLKLINKGVELESVSHTLAHFKKSRIWVHAYLMYGFPSQTTQETVDALEIVRQWFKLGLLQSGFWHRYAMTLHSPSAHRTQEYGVTLLTKNLNPFANNEIYFSESQSTPHDMLGKGLEKALYNFMLGHGLDLTLDGWFDKPIPKTQIAKSLIKDFLSK
jgi:hypothetical protein